MQITWSPDALIDRIGGDVDLAHQLVVLFLLEHSKMLEALRSSIAVGNAEGVRRAAHAFKGSLSNFIDDGPTATALQIEMLGRAGSVADTSALLTRLEHELGDLVGKMRAFDAAHA